MQNKTPIKFLTFNDGIVNIYKTDENDNTIADTLLTFRFGEEKIGITRFYSAKQNDIEVSKVIHIHKNTDLRTDMAAVINGERYKIIQIQIDSSTNPSCSILTLSQRGLYLGVRDEY